MFDYTHVTWPRHDAAHRHSSPLSARHTRTHVAQQALGHRSLLRVVCSESRREKQSDCDALGPGTPCTRSVRRRKSETCNTARRCTPEGALTRASTHELSTPKWGGESCSCSPSAHTVEVEPKSPRLREENVILATLVPTTSATHGTRPLTQIYCRRDRASTTTRVPTDPYHSRRMTTRRCDFRHQPSAGCTYSSSAVLRATSGGVS